MAEEGDLARVRAQIEADKAERKSKTEAPPSESKFAPTAATTVSKPVHDSCRLKIRMQSGEAVLEPLSATVKLSEVRDIVQMKRCNEEGKFSLMKNNPTEYFSEEDMDKSLFELGLCPSSVLIVKKR